MSRFSKITKKGQVTIPKEIRDYLKTDVVRFRIIEGRVVVEPVRDLGGIFRRYVKKSIPFEKERELAWEKVADEYRRNS